MAGDPGISSMVVTDQPPFRVLRDYAEPGATRRMHAHDDASYHVFVLVSGTLTLTVEGQAPVAVTPGEALHLPGGAKTACTLVKSIYSEWSPGPDFTGFHQHVARSESTPGAGGNVLPAQCAVVCSYGDPTFLGIPLRTRFNRFFVGPIASTFIDGGGRVTTAGQTALSDAMTALEEAIVSVPPVATGTSKSAFATSRPAKHGGWRTKS